MTRRLLRVLATTLALVLAIGATAVGGSALPKRIDLPNGWLPEGIDSHGGTIWAGSRADGALWEGSLRRGVGDILVPGVAGKVAVGIDYDPRHDRLWVAGGPGGEVRVYRGRSGRLLQTYVVPGSGFLNDVQVTHRAVYVTDSLVQRLVVIPLRPWGRVPDADAVRTIPLTGDIAYEDGFNVNGITEYRGWLIVVQSNTGDLFRVHRRTGRARLIDTHGFSAVNGDGLEVRHGRLFIARNAANVVSVLRLGRWLDSARLVKELTGGLESPTTMTFGLGALWVVNARFATPPTPDTTYWITRLKRFGPGHDGH